jgi:hypothetical protein
MSNLIISPLFGRLADRSNSYEDVIWIVALSPLVGLAVWLILSQLAMSQDQEMKREPVEGRSPPT